jgi:hypothetical protein
VDIHALTGGILLKMGGIVDYTGEGLMYIVDCRLEIIKENRVFYDIYTTIGCCWGVGR